MRYQIMNIVKVLKGLQITDYSGVMNFLCYFSYRLKGQFCNFEDKTSAHFQLATVMVVYVAC